MAMINPYLNFMGNTEEAFNFYQSVLGGELFIQRFKDTPHGENMSAEDKEKIMHVSLPIGANTLMGTDCLESMGQTLTFGNNFSLTICPDSIADTHRVFTALGEGGKVQMPLENQFWGALFGMLVDKFGVQWMINYQENPPTNNNK
jgi:PhnB protein